MFNNSQVEEEFQENIEDLRIFEDPELECPDQPQQNTSQSAKSLFDQDTQKDIASAIIALPQVTTAICKWLDPAVFSESKVRIVVKCVIDHAKQYSCNPTIHQIMTQLKQLIEKNQLKEELLFDYATFAKVALDHFQQTASADYYIEYCKQMQSDKTVMKAMIEYSKREKTYDVMLNSLDQEIQKSKKIAASNTWIFRDFTMLQEIAETQLNDFLIENWLEFQSLGMISGYSFSGKSCLVAKIINGICKTGTFGNKKVAQDCGILLFDAENKEKVTVNRLKAECDGDVSGINFQQVELTLKEGKLDPLQIEDCINAAKEIIGCEKIFVVIDTMRSILGVDEMETQSVCDCLYPLKKVAERTNAAMLVIHHRPKSGAKYSGSTAITAALDYHWMWESDKDTRIATLSLIGERSGNLEQDLKFQYKDGKNIFLPNGITETVRDHLMDAVDSAFAQNKSLSQSQLIKGIQHHYKQYDDVQCPGELKLRDIIKQLLADCVLVLDDDKRIVRMSQLIIESESAEYSDN